MGPKKEDDGGPLSIQSSLPLVYIYLDSVFRKKREKRVIAKPYHFYYRW